MKSPFQFVIGLISMGLVVGLQAATYPAGFTETKMAASLTSPTSITSLPDGRILVTEQPGRILMFKNAMFVSTAVADLSVVVDSQFERGLLAIAPSPNFSSNGYLYLYYTVKAPSGGLPHNRLSRITLAGDVMVAGSEVTLVNFTDMAANIQWHMGGHLEFGVDGKLYLAVGIHQVNANAQADTTERGKILRFNEDGSIPTDNPFYATNTGLYRAIYAKGLRNSFTFTFQKSTGRCFAHDVGTEDNGFEEINEIVAGANYGFPTTEGTFPPAQNPTLRNPIFAYAHLGRNANNEACTIGGTFYEGGVSQFPAAYRGLYYFAEFISGQIWTINPALAAPYTKAVFATGVSYPTGFTLTGDGSLWYLSRGGTADDTLHPGAGSVYRINYSVASTPSITSNPLPALRASGESVTFTATAAGVEPFSYQWLRNNVAIPLATGATYTIPSVSTADNAATFALKVTNAFGNATTLAAALTVPAGTRPTVTLLIPPAGTTYGGGDTINWTASATDAQDGALGAAALKWSATFYHGTHTHPFLPEVAGVNSGSFSISADGETESNVFYRLFVTATDSTGLSTTVSRDILPRTIQFTLQSDPPGLSLLLDNIPTASGTIVTGVVGIRRQLSGVSPQALGATSYLLDGWLDAAPGTRSLLTPATNSTYVAKFYDAANPPGIVGWRQLNFGISVNEGLSADWADGDQDGLINLLEYAFGTSPNSPAGAPPLTKSVMEISSQQYPTLSFARPATADLNYVVEFSTDLIHWTSGTSVISPISSSPVYSVRTTNPMSAGRPAFMRVRVSRQ